MIDIPSNGRCRQIGPVHQTDAVHDADSEDKSSVDAVDDLLLLLGRELALIRVLVRALAPDILRHVDLCLLDIRHSEEMEGLCEGGRRWRGL